jgi:hypothetical protein
MVGALALTLTSNVTATGVVNGTYTATLAKTKVDGGLTVAIQANGKDVKTAALNTALTAVVTPSDAAVTYQWYKDGVRIADATSATYTPTAKATYTVKATVAATEKTYTKGEYTSGEVVVGGDTISKAELKDNEVTTTRTDIVRGDTLKVSAQVMGETLTYGKDYTVEWYKNGTKISGQSADSLKIDDAKVGDVYKAVVTGKGTYGGDPVESNSLTVTKLGDVSDIVTATNVQVKRIGNVITISGLPVTDVTPGQDYTVDIVKYTTATDSTVSKKTVATIKTVDNEGKATYELSTDDLKFATGESVAFKVVINGAGNYTGSIAPVTVPEPAEK